MSVAETFFFVIASLCALGGAIGVVALRNPFYNVLALVFHLIALAGLFLLLRAQFVAAAQIVVYAGAVMVLYVFVVAYVGGQHEPLSPPAGPLARGGAWLFVGALLAELFIAVLGSGLETLDTQGAKNVHLPAFGSPGAIGKLLLTKFLFAFEAASFLLLIAAVGAVVLARRRAGVHSMDEGRLSVMEVLRPQGTGTMLEAVTGRTGTPARSTAPSEEDSSHAQGEPPLAGLGPRDADTGRGGGW